MPLFGAPGERIGYELYSHPDGAPPLVLIHGFTASKASFEVNLAGLREHFTVVSVELLGHGDSEAPEDPVFYRPERAVRRILQLLEHLGYGRALFCGHSLGGALALRLALRAPGESRASS
ncbi:MAG: alpha/beta fold hydrolase [Dehalococcoidia bacterium]|uniref:alpha/beta fold hydrolase n=1 Tax=Candidatus Amarobacter glycogenicus TaxID=3140699 RepID=UPI003134CC7A|nr:alpha/beta fold hydrolase [Dehalococcoidia bacterium]